MNKLFSSNIAVRVISFLIALVIWVVASDQQISQSTGQEMSKNFYRIPIETVNPPSGYILSFDHNSIESLVLKGNTSLLSSMLGQEISAKIDLDGYSEGEYDVPIQLNYPAGLSLVALQPGKVHVSLVSSVSRVLDLEASLAGTDTEPSRIAKLTYKPDSVLLEGPRQLVENAVKAQIVVDLKGKGQDFEEAYDIQILDRNGLPIEGIALQPSLITVAVKWLPVQEIALRFPDSLSIPSGYEIEEYSFNHSYLSVYGPQSELDSLFILDTKSEPIAILPEQEGLDEIVLELEAQVILPDNSNLQLLREQVLILTLKLVKSEKTPG